MDCTTNTEEPLYTLLRQLSTPRTSELHSLISFLLLTNDLYSVHDSRLKVNLHPLFTCLENDMGASFTMLRMGHFLLLANTWK